MPLPLELIGRRDNDRRRSRLGDIICRLASTNEGEIIATVLALQRLLEAHGVDIHALVEHLENGGGGLSDATKEKVRIEVEQAYGEGYAELAGVRAAESKQHGTGAFRNTDGALEWSEVALFVQREKHRLAAHHHEFIDDMASRTVYGREPTPKPTPIPAQLVLQAGRKDHVMSVQIDEATVRQFIELISEHAKEAINGAGQPGFLQLCRINPLDDKSVVPSRFEIGDVEHMVQTATGDAAAGHNVYIEARTVREGLRGNKRGGLEDTAWVFGLVADCDADKDKGGNIMVKPSLAVETSPGNFQLWYLFTRAIPAEQARVIGDAIRASSGTDQDTGVITQCYRVPGTPNFPSLKKRARGRITVEPTRIFEHTGRLWDPDELMAAFASPVTVGTQLSSTSDHPDEATLPDDLLDVIRHGAGPGADRSKVFHDVVAQLRRRNWTVDAIVELLEKYPDGIAKKYAKRLRKEVERSYGKVAAGTAPPAASTGPASAAASSAPGASAAPHHCHPDHPPRCRSASGDRCGDRARIDRQGAPVFARSGTLVEPVCETAAAADGRKTITARLRPLLSIRCCGQLPRPRSSSASTVNAMPGSMSIRHCSSCVWCWHASDAGPSRVLAGSSPPRRCVPTDRCLQESGLRPAIRALSAGDLAIIPYSRATDERASPRCARHADRPPG